jgi:DNA transposition AAA+ family ATPase
MTEYVATSLARRLIARMQATHERRRISVFAGPPGLGKTTAIDRFAAANAGAVVVVKVARRNAREVLVLQHALEALRNLMSSEFVHAPSSVWELRNDLFGALCAWAGAEPLPARRSEYPPEGFARLTLVFDEAQNLSREAIEALRYWNDADRCYAPFPLGLVFVGNNEFSLSGGPRDSVISAAVADRALYVQTLEYEDLTDEDLRWVIEASADIEPAAVTQILRSFRTPRAQRSLRRVADLLDELAACADGPVITLEDVRAAFGPEASLA